MNKPWSHQAKLKRERIPSPDEIYRQIQSIDNQRDQALVAAAYLTGGRISELVRENFLKKAIFEKGADGKLVKPHHIIRIDKIELNYKGLTKGDFRYEKVKEEQCFVFDMQNRKNRIKKRKELPVLPRKEQRFIKIVTDYIDTLKDDTPLFPFNKHRAYQIIRKNMDMNCHFIRDIRATHLVVIYKFDAFRLMKFMGWSDPRPAARYVQLDWTDIWS